MGLNQDIFHLALVEEWKKAELEGKYLWSTRGKTLEEVGFIHCSTFEQLAGVAEFVFGDYSGDLVLLKLQVGELAKSGLIVKLEDGGSGELFPHIYGAIDVSLVNEVRGVRMLNGKLVY